jgi:hypothetical protein
VYRSRFWYWWKLCFSVYYRPGWYVSLGVHIGRDLELHLLWWIVMLLSRERGYELEEADRWYLKGEEPGGRTDIEVPA